MYESLRGTNDGNKNFYPSDFDMSFPDNFAKTITEKTLELQNIFNHLIGTGKTSSNTCSLLRKMFCCCRGNTTKNIGDSTVDRNMSVKNISSEVTDDVVIVREYIQTLDYGKYDDIPNLKIPERYLSYVRSGETPRSSKGGFGVGLNKPPFFLLKPIAGTTITNLSRDEPRKNSIELDSKDMDRVHLRRGSNRHRPFRIHDSSGESDSEEDTKEIKIDVDSISV